MLDFQSVREKKIALQDLVLELTRDDLRRELNEEAHARPYAAIPSPARLTSLSLYYDFDDAPQRAALADLEAYFNIRPKVSSDIEDEQKSEHDARMADGCCHFFGDSCPGRNVWG